MLTADIDFLQDLAIVTSHSSSNRTGGRQKYSFAEDKSLHNGGQLQARAVPQICH